MGYNYLVNGVGMGRAIALDLIRQPDTDLVTILDKDKGAALRLGWEIPELNSEKVKYIQSSIGAMNLVELFKQFHVVISGLPAKFSREQAEAAILAGVPFCELGGVLKVTKQCLDLDRKAKNAGVSVIIDSGLAPGMSMILGQDLLYKNFRIKELGTYVGGMPQKPRPPIFHQSMFYIGGLKHLCYDPVPILEDGKIVYKKPLTDKIEQIPIPALCRYSARFDHFEAALTAGASIAPWTYSLLGIKIYEKTLRWPGFFEFVKNIEKKDFEETVMPLISTPVDKENPDFVFMRVVAKNQKGDTVAMYELHDEFDPATGLSAMQRTTGFTTAIIARWLAKKKLLPGVNTPETAIKRNDMDAFMKELRHHFNIELKQ